MEKKIRIGIIGIGNMGSAHATSIAVKNACPDLELTAVSDLKESRRSWAKENLPDTVRIFEDADEMLSSGLLDACIVAVPHYDHVKYVKKCMEHGLHVMCEKPAGVYTKEVREMNACAELHPELVFGMMFNQRTNHIYRKMKEIVDSGVYGQIKRTNWIITNWYRTQTYYDSGDWRATWSGEGGGVLLNQCPHQLDLWQWICGMPKTVDAHLYYGKWHDIEVEDDVTAFVEYPNGATGLFITTTGNPHGTNRFEIELEDAELIAEGGKLHIHAIDKDVPMADGVFAKPALKIFDAETDGLNPQHVGVLNAFSDKILGKGELIADGREGINGLMLSNAMHLSSFLGKAVEIPIDEELYYEELKKRIAVSRRKTHVVEMMGEVKGSFAGTGKDAGNAAEMPGDGQTKERWNTNW